MTNERTGVVGSFARLAINNAQFTETRRVKPFHSPMAASANAKKGTLTPLDAPKIYMGQNRITPGTPRAQTI